MSEQDCGPETSLTRIALGIEYDGAGFHGWQIQKSALVRTVQGELQKALSQVANHPVKLFCAGRTDAGVHGCAQVVHFDTPSVRPLKAWINGGNALLPDDVSIHWAQEVSSDFHARFAATARRYRYLIHNHSRRSALLRGRVTLWPRALDAARMSEAAQHLLGENDFSSFRGAQCQSRTPMRNVMHAQVSRRGDFVMLDIKANAFLLHMVRNIAGTLLRIGEGQYPPEWAAEVLAARDRRCAAETAPAAGLYLVEVDYPARFALPQAEPGPPWLQAAGLGQVNSD